MDGRIDKALIQLYTLVLKAEMDVSKIPRAWLYIQQACRDADPNYEIQDVPKYVSLAKKYGRTTPNTTHIVPEIP